MPRGKATVKPTSLDRYERQYEQLKAEMAGLGFVLQGTLRKRWMKCGKPACRCREHPQARHGPYWQWSWKESGKSVSTYLTSEQADLCKKWIDNHRHMERIIKKLRKISLQAARLHKMP